MSIEELRSRLKDIYNNNVHDPEVAHGEADDLLIKFINDDQVTQLYNAIEKWYA